MTDSDAKLIPLSDDPEPLSRDQDPSGSGSIAPSDWTSNILDLGGPLITGSEPEQVAPRTRILGIDPHVWALLGLGALGVLLMLMLASEFLPGRSPKSQARRATQKTPIRAESRPVPDLPATSTTARRPAHPPPPAPRTQAAPPKPTTPLQKARSATALVLAPTALDSDSGSLGSGFFVSLRGHLLTNHHVIDKAAALFVIPLSNDAEGRGPRFRATVAFQDERRDVALLKVEGYTPQEILTPVELTNAEVGSGIVIIGYPGRTSTHSWTQVVTAGRVSSLESYLGLERLRTDAAVAHGNSGGPMILDGTTSVVGLVTLKIPAAQSENEQPIAGLATHVKELRDCFRHAGL